MYEHILLPTDGSPGMAKAIENALYQAAGSGATVHALYVVDLRSFVMLPEDTQQQVIRLLQTDGQEALEFVRQVAEDRGVPVETEMRQGVPQEVILQYVQEADIDLVVMGTHGRTGEEFRILGSIAEEVVRNSRVPVMTVRMSNAEIEKLDTDQPPEEQMRYVQ